MGFVRGRRKKGSKRKGGRESSGGRGRQGGGGEGGRAGSGGWGCGGRGGGGPEDGAAAASVRAAPREDGVADEGSRSVRRLVRAFSPSLDSVRLETRLGKGAGEVCMCVYVRRSSCVLWNVAFKVDLVICDEDWKKGKTRWRVCISEPYDPKQQW